MKTRGGLKTWIIITVALVGGIVGGGATVFISNKINQNTVNGQSTASVATPYPQGSASNYGFQNTSLALGADHNIGSAPNLIPAAEASVHAVVHIKVQSEQSVQQSFDPFDFFFGGGGTAPSQMRPVVGFGSGVIISSDGYIITNNHVIDGADKIEVTLNDNRSFVAKKIGNDPETDIALLKIDAKNLPTIPFGDSDKLRLGEWVLAVGNPFNLTSTVTSGIVSAKARPASSPDGTTLKIGGFIQTDAAVNAGNSGGALVNAQGELVGINTMIYSQTGAFSGYSFAVPINTAAKVVADLKKYGAVQRAVLGIVGRDIDQDLIDKKGLKVNNGAYVADFAEVSPAFAAGIDKEDVIVAVNKKPVKSFTDLQASIALMRPGDKINVTVNRKGTVKDFTVTLKNVEGGVKLLSANELNDVQGVKFEELSSNIRRSFGINYGVQIKDLSNSKFKKAGIKKGFIILSINDKAIRTVDEAKRIIQTTASQNKGERYLVIRGFYPEQQIIITKVVEL